MGAFFATAAPQLGNPAGDQVSEENMNPAFSDEDLARRRSASRRLGWLLGAAVLVIYIIGLFIKR